MPTSKILLPECGDRQARGSQMDRMDQASRISEEFLRDRIKQAKQELAARGLILEGDKLKADEVARDIKQKPPTHH